MPIVTLCRSHDGSNLMGKVGESKSVVVTKGRIWDTNMLCSVGPMLA